MGYTLTRLQEVLEQAQTISRRYNYGTMPYINHQQHITNIKKAIEYVKLNPYISINSLFDLFNVRLNRYKPLHKRVVRPKKDNGVKFKVCRSCHHYLRIKAKGMCAYCYESTMAKIQYDKLTPTDFQKIYAKRKVVA